MYEEFRNLEIDGIKNYYAVSNTGKIKNTDKHMTLKPNVDRYGYLKISLQTVNNKSKKFLIHRLVAIAFIENPYNKPAVNHIDSDRKNNHVSNLEWVTAKENSEHAKKFGNLKSRPAYILGYNKHDIEKIHDICRLLEKGFRVRDIQNIIGDDSDKKFSIKSLIRDIKSRKSWKSISSEYKW